MNDSQSKSLKRWFDAFKKLDDQAVLEEIENWLSLAHKILNEENVREKTDFQKRKEYRA